MKDHKNYEYYKSHILGLEFCVHKEKDKRDRIIFSDGVHYTWPEIEELKSLDEEKIVKIHELKKQYQNYKISELLTILNADELDRRWFEILREVFSGEIIQGA